MQPLIKSERVIVLETSVFRAGDEQFSAGDERVENARVWLKYCILCVWLKFDFSHTHTQLATSDFQIDLRSRRLLLTSTHL